jgi:hypothetical protein
VIIFGVRGRLSTLEGGQFYCPRCRGDRAYARRGVRRWFTLFFVPILPISATTGTRICCDTCKGAFNDDVLSLPTADAFRDLHARAFRQCAVVILKSGDATSALARSAALAAINGPDGGGGELDDAGLDRDLLHVDPAQLAVYASPVANRLGPREAERFFGACAQVALSDGPLSADERHALGVLGESFNLSEAHQLGVIELLRAPVERAADGPPGPP